jgi:DNA-binding Lrp family transcriptional regulator
MAIRKLRVFLCHASQDKPVVRELYQRLLAEGWIDPWLDEEKLLPGQDWDMEIEKAVEIADVVIVCLSSNSVTKEGYIQRELRFVLRIAEEKPEGTIFVIPLRLDNCLVPRRLRDWQYVDYFPDSMKDRSYKRIVKSLSLRRPPPDISNVNNKKLYREELARRRANAIEFVKNRGPIDLHSVANELGISSPKTYRLLGSLEKKGVIVCKYDTSGVGIYSIRSAEADLKHQTSDFKYVRLDQNIKLKDYMKQGTFDGDKVSLKYRVLGIDGSDKVVGILHFEVVKQVREIISELLRLRKVDKNIQYVIDVKAPFNISDSEVLIEKGSEILLRPVENS